MVLTGNQVVLKLHLGKVNVANYCNCHVSPLSLIWKELKLPKGCSVATIA